MLTYLPSGTVGGFVTNYPQDYFTGNYGNTVHLHAFRLLSNTCWCKNTATSGKCLINSTPVMQNVMVCFSPKHFIAQFFFKFSTTASLLSHSEKIGPGTFNENVT